MGRRTTTDDVIEALALRATRARAKARELEGFYRKQLTEANAAAAKARAALDHERAHLGETYRTERDTARADAAKARSEAHRLGAELEQARTRLVELDGKLAEAERERDEALGKAAAVNDRVATIVDARLTEAARANAAEAALREARAALAAAHEHDAAEVSRLRGLLGEVVAVGSLPGELWRRVCDAARGES